MISVLFESHHLYYLPNFLPIIKEMRRRVEYDIFASIPHSIAKEEKNIFYKICDENNFITIVGSSEKIESIKLKINNLK